jgi:hypothetical protein
MENKQMGIVIQRKRADISSLSGIYDGSVLVLSMDIVRGSLLYAFGENQAG